jgi:prepilin-type N-terminal cleavage/methylation domain-containing protein
MALQKYLNSNFLRKGSRGFTIVELLVVIVIIGILAAITIVSYTGISQRAIVSSLQSDLTNAANQLKLDQVTSSSYPATLALANSGKGIPASAGTAYTYAVSNVTTLSTSPNSRHIVLS